MRKLLEELMVPKDAIDWLVMLYDSVQVFDDYADGDPVKREDLDKLIWTTLISMPNNRFYKDNSEALWPLIATAILKWQASDTVERNKKANAISFVWRAGYYDIVLMVYAICFGSAKARKDAHVIMSLYGEKFEEYIEEVNNA